MDTQCCNAAPHVHCLNSAQSVACCNGTGNWYPFAIENDEWKAIFELESTSSVPEKFKPIPSTLRAFLQFLESHAQINVSIPNNKIARVAGVAGDAVDALCTYTIEQDQLCVHKISQKFAKTARSAKPAFNNLGALVDSNLVKESDHVTVFCKMTCPVWPMPVQLRHHASIATEA